MKLVDVNIYNMNTLFYKKGFTLIELMVVVSIIGILSAVVYASFGDAREGAKNKALQSEMKEVQLALEVYKSQNGVYPPPPPPAPVGCSIASFGVMTALESSCGNVPYISGLVPEFIAELPAKADAANSGCTIAYSVEDPGRNWYKLTAQNCHAGASVPADGVRAGDELARCIFGGATGCLVSSGGVCDVADAKFYESYAVYSAGGECK